VRVLGVAVFACALMLLSSAPAMADEVIVSIQTDRVDGNVASLAALKGTPGDDGFISLREAVLAANAGDAINTIWLPSGTYSLEGSETTVSVAAMFGGPLQVGPAIGPGILNIIGLAEDPADVVIRPIESDSTPSRLIDLDPLLAGNVALSLRGITLRDGHAGEDGFGGGAVLMGGSADGTLDSLTIDSCILTMNTCSADATATTNSGGAISAGRNSSLRIESSVITTNTAMGGAGGAVFLSDTGSGGLYVESSRFSGNMSHGMDVTAGQGGALYVGPGSLGATITLSTFESNVATSTDLHGLDRGGAIFGGGGIVMSDNRVLNNVADEADGAYSMLAPFTAKYNWWNTNSDPGVGNTEVAGDIIYEDWLTLELSVEFPSVIKGESLDVTATIIGLDEDFVVHSVPETLPATFASTLGSMVPGVNPLASGSATSTFQAGLVLGSGEITVTVDDVSVTAAVIVEGLPPTISTAPATLEGNTYGGYTGAIPSVSAFSPEGLSVSLVNDAPDPLPLGETVVTWTATDTQPKTAEETQSVTVTDLTPPSDPLSLASSTHTVSVPSVLTEITVEWSDDATDTVSDVTGYSFSWSLGATETPDALVDAGASVLETTSPELSGGNWYFNLRTADAAGNWTNTLHAGPFIISRGPDIAAIPDPGPISSSDITVTVIATSSFGVDGVYYRIDSSVPNIYTMPFVVSAPGEHTITYWAIDGLGDVSADTLDVTVDPDPPVVTHDAPVGWQTAPVTVTFEADDMVSGVASIDMTWYAPFSGTTTASVAGDTAQLVIDELGLNTIEYSAVDTLGNRSALAFCDVLMDTTPPDVSIVADSDWSNTPVTVTINASADLLGIDEVLYWVGGAGPTTYTGPFQISAEGAQLVTAQAFDHAGNSAWASPATVRIDTSKPTDPILIDDSHIFGVASSLDQITVGLFGATDALSGVAGYSYWFTQNAFDLPAPSANATSGVTSVTSGPLSDGEWYVHLRTGDAVGNWTSTVHRGPYIIDTQAPTADDNAPASWVSYSYPFEVNADDGPGSGVTSIDVTMTPVIGPVVAETVPGDHFEFLVVNNGVTAFEYAARDMVGNISASAVATVGIDTFAPDTTDDVVATGWQSSDVTVTLTPSDIGSGIAVTYYRVNDMPKQTYTGPFVVSAQDITDITYWSVDNVGNVEEFKQAESIYIDKSAPAIGTYRLPATGWASGTALAGATGNDLYSYVYRIWSSVNGAPYTAVFGDVYTYTTSTEGTTTVEMYAEDAAGNTSNVETVTLLVDNTAPVTGDDAPVEWVSGDATVTLAATDALSGVADTFYVIDSGPRQTYAGPFAVSGEGSHDVVYWSVDLAGNTEEAKSALVRIDRSGPVVTDDSTPDWQTGPVTVTLTEADAGADSSTFRYTIDGGIELATNASFEVTGNGLHELEYYGIDSLGNVGPTGRATLRIDNEAPVSVSDIDSEWQQGPVDVVLTATDSHAGVWTMSAIITRPSVSMAPTSIARDRLTFTVSAEGTNTVEYYATDAVGNMEIPNSEIVRIDNTAPVVSITPTATAAIDAITYTVSATDALSGVDIIMLALDGGAPQAADTIRIDTVGDHTVTYWAVDEAGNESAHATHDVRISASATAYIEVAGASRYDTAVEASIKSYPTGSNAVIIATGSNWPDALGGAALAGVYDAPVLLTPADVLPDAVAAEIVRLDPSHVFVLGGTSVVSEDVEAQIRELVVPTANLERFWGADRYTTIQIIARRAIRDADAFDGTAFVATGLSFPDALAAAPLATALQRPLYLAGPEGLSATTLAAMSEAGVTDVVVLGGTSAVPAAVEGQLDTSGIGHARIAGTDRYDTALQIADSGVTAGLSWDRVALTCGTDFPDALAGGVMQGHVGSVMVLTHRDVFDPRVRDALAAQRDIIGEVRFVGGLNAVSQAVRDGVKQVLR